MSNRIELTVLVDLDQMPGVFHTKESAQQVVTAILLDRIGHYNPVVLTNHVKSNPLLGDVS